MATQQQRMDIRLDQKLVMTPQLQLAIKLLQMQTIDLQTFVDQEVLENPFLANEEGSEEEATAAQPAALEERDSAEAMADTAPTMNDEGLPLDMGWDSMYDSGKSSSGSAVPLDDETSWENTATRDQTLKDHLVQQLGTATDDPVLRFLGNYLIDAINDAGYLTIDPAETAKRLNVPLARLEEALRLIQGFDPAGVGATSLAECLRLQLEQMGGLTPVDKVVLDHLELLAKGDYARLARLANVDAEEVAETVATIKSLTPKPGLKYGSDAASNVVPDVVVVRKDGAWSVELNADAMPRVLLSKNYQSLMDGAAGEGKSYMNERLSRAQWLLKSLEQRAKTIFKVAKAIVAHQEDFFNLGVESLKPMTLKTIAEIVGAHESTVSRVTNGKYIQTPLGVFELKYFFSSAISTTGGNTTVASESVRQMIKRLIGEEDARKPLSDERLVEMLKAEGVDVARRTVAKYREGLGISSSSGRRIKV